MWDSRLDLRTEKGQLWKNWQNLNKVWNLINMLVSYF